jgi:hypothetical protein
MSWVAQGQALSERGSGFGIQDSGGGTLRSFATNATKKVQMSNKRKRAELDRRRAMKRDVVAAAQRAEAIAAGRVANGIVLPDGAIAADLTKQRPNNSYSPKLFYTDEPFRCIDCGKDEVWTAERQKWFYEVAQGSVYARAVRCRSCRREHREFLEHRRRRSQGKAFDLAVIARGVSRAADRKARQIR